VWLVAITLMFFMIYVVFSYNPTDNVWSVMESFQFTIEQPVRPFSAWLPSGGILLKPIFGSNAVAVLGLQILATIQAIISLSLITLFILALRRRFKFG